MKKYIYKITNTINKKIYIGQTKDINRRFREHRQCGYNRVQNKYLYNAIKKYGVDAFTFEILEYVENYNEREHYWINYFESTNSNKGYNIDNTGTPHHHKKELTEQELFQLYQDLQEDLDSYKVLAKKYGFVSEQSIRDINKGIIYNRPNIQYPLRLDRNTKAQLRAKEIIELLLNTSLSFQEIAEKVNTPYSYVMNINAGRRCKIEGISYPVRSTKANNRKPYRYLSQETVKAIKTDIKYTNLTWEQLSQKYQVGTKVFQHINRGTTYFDANEQYPLRKIKQYDKPVETMEGQSSSTSAIDTQVETSIAIDN